MGHAPQKNGQYMKSRDASLMKLYKDAIGAPKMFVLGLIAMLEILCFLADLTAFGALFGQAMGDTIGKIAAGSISLLFPLGIYLCFNGIAGRFANRKARERLSVAILVAMVAFLLVTLVIRFPLEAAAASEDGVGWQMSAAVYCLPAISAVIGTLAASLMLHNPETELKIRTAKLRARITDMKSEIAALEGSNPEKLRNRLERIYRAGYCEVDGMMNSAIAESVGTLVARHGLAVHDYLGKLPGSPSGGTSRYDSRPPEFAAASIASLGAGARKLELDESSAHDLNPNALPNQHETVGHTTE